MLVIPSEGMPVFGTAESRDLFPDFFASLFSRAAKPLSKTSGRADFTLRGRLSWNLVRQFPELPLAPLTADATDVRKYLCGFTGVS